MVLTAYFVLSPAIGLSCHRHLADASARLDAGVEASGPHDFAVRVSAVRLASLPRHRIPPRVRDDREPPLCVGRDGRYIAVIGVSEKPKYFCAGDWTGQISMNSFEK